MEIQIINYLSTPSKSQCNNNNFNDFNGPDTLESCFPTQYDSHIEKNESSLKKNLMK